MTSLPTVTRLESGYWLVRWNREVWAQWPVSRVVRASDFFSSEWTATPERLKFCEGLVDPQMAAAGKERE